MPSVGRPPKRRDNFLTDAQGLLHLARAIREDDRRPVKWRDMIVSQIMRLQSDLLNAPGVEP